MWEWFTANSVWIFIAAAFVLIILFIGGNQIRDKLVKSAPEKWQERLRRSTTVTFWTTEGIAFVIIILALVTIVLPREGIPAVVTPETIRRLLLEHGTRIILILLFGIALWFGLKRFLPLLMRHTVVRTRGESREEIKKRTDTLLSVFMGAGKIFIIIIVVFMVLSELDISIAPVLAGFGIAGIAVGFGAQYLIRDLIAGIFIILENQYRVGDVARIAGIAGLVEQVNLRKTVLRDLDGIVHHIPNGEIKVASNFTRHFSRVNLNISVAYGTDLDHAISVMNRVGQELAADENWSGRIKSAPQVLRVDNLGDSGIDIKILGDVKPLEQWNVTGELRKRIKKAFDEEGIEIPWPHVKIYFGPNPANDYLPCKACAHPNLVGSKFCSNCGAALGLP